MADQQSSWGSRIFRVAVGLTLAVMIAGWAWDHQRQHAQLAPLEEHWSERTIQYQQLQTKWQALQRFDGFHGWDDILESMLLAEPDRVFERISESITHADDAVYSDAIPKLIAMLDDEDPVRRQCAWRLLQSARKSPRFADYEPSYRQGVVALLHHPSILAFNSLLPWLRLNHMNSPEVLAGLRERMMDDQDEFAPQAAYALAELDPAADIAPRLLELIERKHVRWKSILHKLPNYMPKEEAKQVYEKYRDDL